jgi:hypothetical protein
VPAVGSIGRAHASHAPPRRSITLSSSGGANGHANGGAAEAATVGGVPLASLLAVGDDSDGGGGEVEGREEPHAVVSRFQEVGRAGRGRGGHSGGATSAGAAPAVALPPLRPPRAHADSSPTRSPAPPFLSLGRHRRRRRGDVDAGDGRGACCGARRARRALPQRHQPRGGPGAPGGLRRRRQVRAGCCLAGLRSALCLAGRPAPAGLGCTPDARLMRPPPRSALPGLRPRPRRAARCSCAWRSGRCWRRPLLRRPRGADRSGGSSGSSGSSRGADRSSRSSRGGGADRSSGSSRGGGRAPTTLPPARLRCPSIEDAPFRPANLEGPPFCPAFRQAPGPAARQTQGSPGVTQPCINGSGAAQPAQRRRPRPRRLGTVLGAGNAPPDDSGGTGAAAAAAAVAAESGEVSRAAGGPVWQPPHQVGRGRVGRKEQAVGQAGARRKGGCARPAVIRPWPWAACCVTMVGDAGSKATGGGGGAAGAGGRKRRGHWPPRKQRCAVSTRGAAAWRHEPAARKCKVAQAPRGRAIGGPRPARWRGAVRHGGGGPNVGAPLLLVSEAASRYGSGK